MKSLLIIMLGLLSMGFIVDSPEARRNEERRSRELLHALSRQYDLRKIREFLVKEVQSKQVYEGVDLSKSKIGPRWTATSAVLVCGDWMMMGGQNENQFRLIWEYDKTPEIKGEYVQKSFAFECLKVSHSEFRVVSAHKYEEQMIILIP